MRRAASAAVLGGIVYVHFGEYRYAFLRSAVMALLAALLVLNLQRRPPRLGALAR